MESMFKARFFFNSQVTTSDFDLFASSDDVEAQFITQEWRGERKCESTSHQWSFLVPLIRGR